MRFARAYAFALLAVASFVAPVLADQGGGTLSVSPIRIAIREADRAQTATVINGGSAPIDVAVDAYGWTQRAGYPLVLSESKNLLVYPRLLHIAAHAERIVKVGIVDALAPTERSYRLSFTQVPNETEDISATRQAVSFRMRITMPVFIAPKVATPAALPFIEKASVEPHAIRIWLKNAGAVHAVIPAIDVDATDARGTHLARTETAGWYVLAGAEQTFTVPSEATLCARIARLNISVHTDLGATIVNGVVPDSACAR